MVYEQLLNVRNTEVSYAKLPLISRFYGAREPTYKWLSYKSNLSLRISRLCIATAQGHAKSSDPVDPVDPVDPS